MYSYDPEPICRTIITDRIREADHRRLAREIAQSELRSNSGAATASTNRRSRLWKLVHLSHAYG